MKKIELVNRNPKGIGSNFENNATTTTDFGKVVHVIKEKEGPYPFDE